MSTADETFEDLREAFLAGNIDAADLRGRLTGLAKETEREELWVRWAEQGLFDGPIDKRGFTSFKGARVREVDVDGERR